MMDDLIEGLPWNKKLEILRAVKGWTQVEAARRCNANQKWKGFIRLEKYKEIKFLMRFCSN